MPKYAEPEAMTPFAQVLTEYMWNRRLPHRRPMSVPQLAARLGMPRQNVNNWVYRGTVPTLEIVLAVMTRLNIPMSALYDAYTRAGLPVPPWDEADAEARATNAQQPQQLQPEISRSRRHTAIPVEQLDQQIDQLNDPAASAAVPTPLPYTPPARLDPAQAAADDLARTLQATEAQMRELGMPDDVIQAALNHIKQQASPARLNPREQMIAGEHAESSESPGQSLEQHGSEQRRTRKSSAPSR